VLISYDDRGPVEAISGQGLVPVPGSTASASARAPTEMDDELAELRARVAELERRVAALFEQTGASDWEAAAPAGPRLPDLRLRRARRGRSRGRR
jgi:hypothetical protein